MSVQYYANPDTNGNIIGFYGDDIWDVTKIPTTAVKITQAQWLDAIVNQGKYVIQSGSLSLAATPTMAQQLTTAQTQKIAELNDKCKQTILGGFTSTVSGVSYQFSYDAEAQSNFTKAGRAFDKAIITSIKWTAYDSTGNVVRLTLDAPTFDSVFKDSLAHLNTQLSKFRDTLQPQVMACTTVAQVQAISW
ncbi:hypothetical protein O9H85_08105 [Paenibacillus filicis]|uniref:DUF4376 domain-containing protein n=1 Tax=Paenibacillus gyeongsangnamensis TaxID=3388067 RepID=A0ABT4Q6R4_9BACL|nr:hypothetical protein [Paenibacillus filicis]MCZ8512395.1 hypothetical protein [Paenibacillus filicis]